MMHCSDITKNRSSRQQRRKDKMEKKTDQGGHQETQGNIKGAEEISDKHWSLSSYSTNLSDSSHDSVRR